MKPALAPRVLTQSPLSSRQVIVHNHTFSNFFTQNVKKINGVCDYGGHCLALAKIIRENTPNADIICKRGRRGSFEVQVNDKLIYSKLQTMALPDYQEVAQVVNAVSQGEEPQEIKGQQPINCVIS